MPDAKGGVAREEKRRKGLDTCLIYRSGHQRGEYSYCERIGSGEAMCGRHHEGRRDGHVWQAP